MKAEAMAHAEQQLAADRTLTLATLATLGDQIANRSKSGVAKSLAEITWLEHRMTQGALMVSPLWCSGCAGTNGHPAEYPGNPWMIFECLDHLPEDQLQRSTKSWQFAIFGGVA